MERPELDQYEQAGMDEGDYDAMNVDQRRAAEKALDQENMARQRG